MTSAELGQLVECAMAQAAGCGPPVPLFTSLLAATAPYPPHSFSAARAEWIIVPRVTVKLVTVGCGLAVAARIPGEAVRGACARRGPMPGRPFSTLVGRAIIRLSDG